MPMFKASITDEATAEAAAIHAPWPSADVTEPDHISHRLSLP